MVLAKPRAPLPSRLARQKDIHPVVRQDEAAGAGIGGDGNGNGAHAVAQGRGHEAGLIAMHDRIADDGLARQDGRTHHRALDGVLFAARRLMGDEGGIHRRGGPFLPAHQVGLQCLTRLQVAAGHEHFAHRNNGRGLGRHLRRAAAQHAAHQKSRAAGCHDGKTKHNKPLGVHGNDAPFGDNSPCNPLEIA